MVPMLVRPCRRPGMRILVQHAIPAGEAVSAVLALQNGTVDRDVRRIFSRFQMADLHGHSLESSYLKVETLVSDPFQFE